MKNYFRSFFSITYLYLLFLDLVGNFQNDWLIFGGKNHNKNNCLLKIQEKTIEISGCFSHYLHQQYVELFRRKILREFLENKNNWLLKMNLDVSKLSNQIRMTIRKKDRNIWLFFTLLASTIREAFSSRIIFCSKLSFHRIRSVEWRKKKTRDEFTINDVEKRDYKKYLLFRV